LYKRHYAPTLICTGGEIPFLSNYPGSEAAVMARLLQESWGIDSSAIIIEDRSKNTHENGENVRALFEQRRLKKNIILVTSAMHMYRSNAIFKKYGFIVHPAPADFLADKFTAYTVFSFIPTAEALFMSTTALHEYYGIATYSFLGWM
jgi:uncharacterized SAM-binding protein YcdF (DUF218 family)